MVHNQKTILPTFFKPLAKFATALAKSCHRHGKSCQAIGKSLFSLFLLNIIREVSCYRTIHYFCSKYLKEDAQ